MKYTLDKYNLGNRIIRDGKGNVVISKPIPFLRKDNLKLEEEMIEILNKLNTVQPKTKQGGDDEYTSEKIRTRKN